MSIEIKNWNETPLQVVAEVSRLVTKVTDRVSGDRSEYPLFVASVTAHVLNHLGIPSNVFYGSAAWVEVMEDQSVMWVGCWGEHTHFWVTTAFGEVVDLTTAVSHRKKAHQNALHKPKYSPPLVWAREVPKFYQYRPEGLVEMELDAQRDQDWFKRATLEIQEKLGTLDRIMALPLDQLDFPGESILCPNRKLLDDAAESFRHMDRAFMIQGIPPGPLETIHKNH